MQYRRLWSLDGTVTNVGAAGPLKSCVRTFEIFNGNGKVFARLMRGMTTSGNGRLPIHLCNDEEREAFLNTLLARLLAGPGSGSRGSAVTRLRTVRSARSRQRTLLAIAVANHRSTRIA